MNSDWKAFLESRSATVDGDRARFADAPAAADCALTDLSQLGLIRVSGPEAADFLQGQLTCDVRTLTQEQSRLGSHLTPKGRMLASFRILRQDDDFHLILPRSVLPALRQRLSMFLLRAKAIVTDASEELVIAGLAGECASDLLAPHLPALPGQNDEVAAGAGGLTAVRIPGPVPRFMLIAAPEAMQPLWAALSQGGAREVDGDHWALLDIRAGLPQVLPQTADAFVPQMVNLQLIGGVSFTKGCYTGQEVVARMQYLGKLKRRMYIAELTADAPPLPGQELHAEGGTSEQASGRVVDARAAGPGRYELLAVIETDAVENREVRLGGPDGPVLSFREPPYGFPAEG